MRISMGWAMIFIDTGAFFARFVLNDGNHQRAAGVWDKLASERIFTSDLVLCETAELLARKAGHDLAVQNVRLIYNTSQLTILRPAKDDEIAALDVMAKFADQRIGFADCVSFVLMQRNRIRRAFSFDHHFQLAGFTLWPGSA